VLTSFNSMMTAGIGPIEGTKVPTAADGGWAARNGPSGHPDGGVGPPADQEPIGVRTTTGMARSVSVR